MDVERTMEFILQSQAKAEVRMDRAEVRMDRADARMDRMEARIDRMELRFDKRLDGLTKIVRTGMKLVNQLVAEQRKLADEMRALAAAQSRTDRSLNNFIDSLRKGKNGR